jgi:ribonuclease J
VPRFLTEDEAGYVPRDKILMICTGSQGEPRAALARIAREDHPNIVIEEGDVVIFSSRIIPGNEKAIGRLHNALIRLGIDIVTDEDHFVHVSGHPYQDELVRMYQMTRPQVAIPVHGEARHLLAHADLARRCQVPEALVIENGALVRLDRAGSTVVDEFPVGRIGSDGKSLLPIGGAVLQQRRRVGNDGSVVATLVVDRGGRLAAPPQISLVGLAEANAAPAAALCDALSDAMGEIPVKLRQDDNALREAARRVLRRGVNERFGKRSLIEIQLVRL